MGLFAVHLSDGLLTPAWWLGGWVVAALLVLLGAWRLRDEDVPRVALLAAVFFVVSLIHVPVPGGPRTHLLLAGLIGVVLGRHAALAIPLGLLLQTILFSHGGLTMIGVNSVVMTVPALLAWLLFAGLRRLPGRRTGTFRGALIFGSVVLFGLSAVFAGSLLATNPWTETEHLETASALAIAGSPWMLLGVAALGLLAVAIERRTEAGPDFALGLLVGEVAVLLTVALNGLVLLLGGVGDWHALVFLTVLLHLPLAVVEGVVLGFTVRFLARVQPDLLGLPPSVEEEPTPTPTPPSMAIGTREGVALMVLLLLPLPVRAHGFEAQASIDTSTRTIVLECWYETGETPRAATYVVQRADGSTLTTGKCDAEGKATFTYEKVEDLAVTLTASGHRTRLDLPAAKLAPQAAGTVIETTRGQPLREFLRDLVSGLAFLLALAAFLLGWRNSRRLRELASSEGERGASAP